MRDRGEERQLHRRPEVDVDQPQAHLLGAGLVAGLLCELVGYGAHASVLSSGISGRPRVCSTRRLVTRCRRRPSASVLGEAALSVARDRDDAIVVVGAGEHDTHGVAALGGDLGHGRAYHLAAGKNHQDLVVLARPSDRPRERPDPSLRRATLMPRPPRLWPRYCAIAVRFAYPPSVTTKTNRAVLGDGCRQQAVAVDGTTFPSRPRSSGPSAAARHRSP